MSKVDIFEQGKVLSIQPFYLKELGDKVQGTYIGVKKNVCISEKYGQMGNVYQLSTDEGIKEVSFGLTKKINDDMKYVKLGQIIGFQHFGKKQMKDGREFNDIKIIADPKIVDADWLAQNEGKSETETVVSSAPHGMIDLDAEFPTEEAFVSESSSPEAKIKAISDLAKEKLGVIDPLKVKDIVMEKTGLAFLPMNYMAIINALTNL